MPELVICNAATESCKIAGCLHAQPHEKQIMQPDYTCAFPDFDGAWCNESWSWNRCEPTGNNEK